MSRSKTTSIPRPSDAPKASDAGRSRLGDYTRPIPVDKRILRRPRLALFGGLFVLVVTGAVGAAVFVLPVQTWLDQDVALAERQAELERLQETNAQLDGQVERLQTDDGVREAAKAIGFIEAGDERSKVMPLPPLPSDLPDGWPYNVVTEILEARRAGPAPTTAD